MATTISLVAISQAHTDLLENIDYDDGSGDVTKARKLKNALRILLAERPNSTQAGGSSGEMVRFDNDYLMQLLKAVEAWLRVRSYAVQGGGLTHTRYCPR